MEARVPANTRKRLITIRSLSLHFLFALTDCKHINPGTHYSIQLKEQKSVLSNTISIKHLKWHVEENEHAQFQGGKKALSCRIAPLGGVKADVHVSVLILYSPSCQNKVYIIVCI